MAYVVIFEFGPTETPKAYGLFASRERAQAWLELVSLQMNPNLFKRATVQLLENPAP